MKSRMLQIAKWTSVLSLAMALLPNSLSAQEDSTSFVADADTYLRSTSPDNGANYGTKTFMNVRNSTSAYQQMGLIRFDASGFNLPATVQLDSAKVYMTVGDGLNAAINVRLISVADSYDSWDENAITWNSYKAGDLDTTGTVATTRVGAKHVRYSWDVTDYLREELVNRNKIVSLAVFQDYNTGANTTFVTRDSATDVGNKPFLALFTHVVPVKVVYLTPTADRTAGIVTLDWKTAAESNTAYAVVQRSTDGSNFTEIGSHLTVQGNKADTTVYSSTDSNPVSGYTNYYRIKYVMTDNSSYISDVVSVPFFARVGVLEDAYVQLAGNGTNHGTETKLLVKNDGNSSYSRISFLKFDLSGFAGTPQAASLHLTVNSANTGIASVTWFLWHINDNSWTESAITGKTYPAMTDSSLIISQQPGRAAGTVDFNIPVNLIRDALASDGILSLAISSDNKGSTDDVSFVSNDSSNVDARPLLLISEDPADNVTPVTISKLTATSTNSQVTLSWKAFTELNTARFDIERSLNGWQFSKIGAVEARGTATTTKAYAFIDKAPGLGYNYYRLTAVDNNGDSSYSNIAGIQFGGSTATASWKVYPNPVVRGQQLTIVLAGAAANAATTGSITARIIDLTGRVVRVQKLAGITGNGTTKINTTPLASGVYFIQLRGDNGQVLGTAQKISVK